MSLRRVEPTVQSDHSQPKSSSIVSPKSYRIGVAVLFGFGGITLLGFGMHRYMSAKTFSATAAIAAGGVFSVTSIILGICEYFWGAKPNSTTRQTGASLLSDVRSDPKTIAGACKILGIPESQINNKTLIEEKKTKLVTERRQTLERLLKTDSTASNKNLETKGESAVIQGVRLMINDVEAAYQTLSQHSSS